VKISLTATHGEISSGPVIFRGSIREAFSLASRLGYDGVELHIRHPSEFNPEEARKLVQEYGLGIPTLGTGIAAIQDNLTFSDPDPGMRHQTVERIREFISLAAYLDTAVTIGSILGRLAGEDPQQRFHHQDVALECLQECVRVAGEAGVTILLEPLNRYERDYLNTVEEGVRLIGEIGMPNLKLLADTFHMNIEETDITASLRTAGPDLGHVHLADTNRQAPGYGHLDLQGVIRALQDIGYEGYLSFEVLPLPTFRQAAEDGIRTVREVLAGL
jgi:sugar phosphate isomerase/epimerase